MYQTGYHETGYHATGYYLPSEVGLPASEQEGYSGVTLDRTRRRKDEEELMLIIQLFIETIS